MAKLLGERARRIPLSVGVRSDGRALVEKYRFEVARNDMLTPGLLFMPLQDALAGDIASSGPATMAADLEVRLEVGRVRAVASVSMGMLIALGVLALFTTRTLPIPISKWLRVNAIVVFGIALAGLFALLGWGMATRRFRTYAVVTAAALVFGHWFNMSAAWFFILLGMGVGGCGAVVLSRFIRDYPRMNVRDQLAHAKRYRLVSGRIED
mgnify:CR=1 FL=1